MTKSDFHSSQSPQSAHYQWLYTYSHSTTDFSSVFFFFKLNERSALNVWTWIGNRWALGMASTLLLAWLFLCYLRQLPLPSRARGKMLRYVHKVKLFMASTWYLISSPVAWPQFGFWSSGFLLFRVQLWICMAVWLTRNWCDIELNDRSQVESSCGLIFSYTKSCDTCVFVQVFRLNHKLCLAMVEEKGKHTLDFEYEPSAFLWSVAFRWSSWQLTYLHTFRFFISLVSFSLIAIINVLSARYKLYRFFMNSVLKPFLIGFSR